MSKTCLEEYVTRLSTRRPALLTMEIQDDSKTVAYHGADCLENNMNRCYVHCMIEHAKRKMTWNSCSKTPRQRWNRLSLPPRKQSGRGMKKGDSASTQEVRRMITSGLQPFYDQIEESTTSIAEFMVCRAGTFSWSTSSWWKRWT